MKNIEHSYRRPLFLALLVCLFLLLPALGSGAETRLEASSPTGLKGVLTFAAAPLQAMTETPFRLQLYTAEQSPLAAAQVTLNLDMPAMPMPKNSPPAVWRDDAYRGVAVFTMAGAWQVKMKLKRSDGSEEGLVFDIEQVLMK